MSSRRSIRRVVVGTMLGLALVVLVAGPAAAHVEIDPESVPKGSTTSFSFRVPTEKETASTVGLEVTFPTDHPIPSVSVLVKSGWTYTVEKTPLPQPVKTESGEVTEAVSKVTWTGGQIPPDGYDLFTVRGGPLPKNVNQLEFKATQTYSDGEVVQWIEPTVKGGAEPEHPAPALKLGKAGRGSSR
ncbi:MAG TPA: YcnI family protein [Acidimicrobiia bacterium]|nr:YcnI family protein [Acidimicrobiia bacterium]